MPDPTTKTLLRGLILSAHDLRVMTDWPEALIEDYLNILYNFALLADKLDIKIDQKIEEISTDFLDGSVPYAESGFLVEDNTNFFWNSSTNTLYALNVQVGSLTANMSVATDSNKNLVSIPYLNEETEFFIHAVTR